MGVWFVAGSVWHCVWHLLLARSLRMGRVPRHRFPALFFKDFNSNGVLDSASDLAADHGVANITVRAFAAGQSTPSATASSSATGAYTLTGLTSAGAYRIEFSALPSDYSPSFAGSGSSVQFANAGATNVNFALNAPCDYCQNAPYFATSFRINGDPLAGGGAGSLMSTLALPYSASGDTPIQHVTMTVGSQTGALWGMAYRRETRTLYTAAVVQRHIGFGPLGIGGIYTIAVDNPSAVSTATAAPFVDLASLSVMVGANPRNPGDLSSDHNLPSHDPGAFDAVGKIGMGGIDVSDDGGTLWVVNLNGPELLSLPLNIAAPAAADVTHIAIPSPACANGVFRPFAVKARYGRVYVGGVCSAEGASASAADLQAHVLVHDPAGAPGNFTSRINVPVELSAQLCLDADRRSLAAVDQQMDRHESPAAGRRLHANDLAAADADGSRV